MLPLILENSLQLMTNLIAAAMVGRLDAFDVSAQGMATKVTDVVYYIFRGTGTALVVLTAKYFAQNKIEECRYIFKKTSVSAAAIGLIAAVVLLVAPKSFLHFFTDDVDLVVWAARYLRIIVLCLPFWAVMLVVSAVYQGVGNTRTPMILALIINLINVTLCWLFIFGNLGFPEMGFLGAAMSLVISRVVGCFAGLSLIFHEKTGVFKKKNKARAVDGVLRELYSIALPAAGEPILWQISSILLSRTILVYGADAFAAYQLGVQAEYITEIPAIGFSVAATSLISKAVGLGDHELFAWYRKEMARICIGISAVTTALLMLFPRGFMSLLTNHEELILIGGTYVFVMGTIQIPQNLIKVYSGILRSTGYKNTPMLIEATGTWGLRIPTALLSAYVFQAQLYVIWLCITADQLFKFVLSYLVLKYKVRSFKTI